MVQCEMCGVDAPAPTTVKVEGAELQVCADCAEFGTEVTTQSDGTTTTKYSTGEASGGSSDPDPSGTSDAGGSSRPRRRDMFDEMEEIVEDYDRRIRDAREASELTQAELADELNEKTSLIRKLERGEHLPSDTIRHKLERELGIELLERASADEDATEWSGGDTPSGMTLGDVVKRKD